MCLLCSSSNMLPYSAPLESGLLITSRFSMEQMIFLLSYMLLQSSLPARLDDGRQIQDIVSRKRTAWYPRIGEDGFNEMKRSDWNSISPTTREHWGSIRNYLLQERLIQSRVSSEDIRTHTCDILCRIEQISSHTLNAVITPRVTFPASTTRLGERAYLTLVCLSVGVTSTPMESRLSSLITALNQQQVQRMVSEVHRSPLFPNPCSEHELLRSLGSLEVLFCTHDQNVDAETSDDEPINEEEFVIEIQERVYSSWWCATQPQPPNLNLSSPATKEQRRRRQTNSTPGGLRLQASPTSCQHRSSKKRIEGCNTP